MCRHFPKACVLNSCIYPTSQEILMHNLHWESKHAQRVLQAVCRVICVILFRGGGGGGGLILLIFFSSSFSLYFLILCRLVFLFSLFCAVWLSKQVSPYRSQETENSFCMSFHFLCISLFCAGKSFYFLYFVPFGLAFKTSLSKSHLLPTCE